MEHDQLKPMLLDLISSIQAAQQALLMELSDAEQGAVGTPERFSTSSW